MFFIFFSIPCAILLVPTRVIRMAHRLGRLVWAFFLISSIGLTSAKKKSVLDYDETDVHRVYKEWLENDEELERDEIDELDINPLKQRETPFLSDLKMKDGVVDRARLMRMAHSGKPIMMFVAMRPGVTQHYTENVSTRWAQSLLNAHLQVERYIVAPDRVMFMVRDGAQAWDIKEFLVNQSECVEVVLNNQNFPCSGTKPRNTEL